MKRRWRQDQRYKATALTGFTIVPGQISRDTARKPRTTWYVLDRAYNHETIAHFNGPNAEREARKLVRRLNNEERALDR
jgi:hypothetical protein